MGTTTIRLPDELKARVAAAAQDAGTTAHGFMLEAIAEKTEEAERRAAFYADADRRYAEFLKTGTTVPWSDARQYLEECLVGKSPAKRVVARKLDRVG